MNQQLRTINKLGYKFDVIDEQVPGDKDFWDLVDKGQWEENLFHILKNNLAPTSVYVDIGAWIGPTVLFAEQITPYCYAVEPDYLAFDALQVNMKLSNSTVIANKVAIMNYTGEVELGIVKLRGDSSCSVIRGINTDNYKVQCVTLKDYFKANNLSWIDFIKIDVEGAEIIILKELGEILNEIGQPIVHLSTHQKFFPNRNKGIKSIIEFIKLYNVPSEEIERIEREDCSDILLKPSK